MSVTSGNLPTENGTNSTQQYFNNFYVQQPTVGPSENDAVVAYFQMITGDKETGKTLAGAVVYTCIQQSLDPVAVVEQLKKFSDKNRLTSPTYSSETNKDAVDTDVYNSQTGTWSSSGNQYAKPGPSVPYNNLSELDAYLTMLLNLNRVGTSLLGLTNSPRTGKYIQRTILA
jgi:hypothetical protein